MSTESDLTCPACEETFDPSPNGGFCPDCDTPHPEYGMDDEDATEDEITEAEPADGAGEDEAIDESETDADGSEADADEPETDEDGPDVDAEASETDAEKPEIDAQDAETDGETETDADTVECPDCGASVPADANFCPECGADLTSLDEGDEDDDVDAVECPDCGASVPVDAKFCSECGVNLQDDGGDEEAGPITLVVNGESYAFDDGDTFGRQDDAWLDDLIEAAGGRDETSYISGTHLEFSVEDGDVLVTDVSTNGTALNGESMDGDTESLENGDTLELAERAEITVEL